MEPTVSANPRALFAAAAPRKPWTSSGRRTERFLSIYGFKPPRETFATMLVRLGRRKDSLLMRVDLNGPHDTTYVFGKTLWKMRVQTLNPQRNWWGWINL